MFEGLARDNRSGATALTRAAAEQLLAVAASSKAGDPGTFWEELNAACRELIAAQREMASIVNLAGRVLAAAERVVLSGLSPDAARQAVHVECVRAIECAAEARARLAKHGAVLIADGAVVATVSSSETVTAVLAAAAAAGRVPRVIVSESRPAGEGASLAVALREHGIASTIVADAALPGLVGRAALVLVGADSVSETDFVNKIGTYPVALAAREADVPLHVAASLDRFIPGALRGRTDRLCDGAEILASPPPGVAVENRYFEAVPLSLAAGIVTEEGVKPPAEAARVIEGRPVPPALLSILYPRA
jgi:translation initiation factor eIF-2B subunit delta